MMCFFVWWVKKMFVRTSQYWFYVRESTGPRCRVFPRDHVPGGNGQIREGETIHLGDLWMLNMLPLLDRFMLPLLDHFNAMQGLLVKIPVPSGWDSPLCCIFCGVVNTFSKELEFEFMPSSIFETLFTHIPNYLFFASITGGTKAL